MVTGFIYRNSTHIPTEKCKKCGFVVIPIAGSQMEDEDKTVLVYYCPEDDLTWRREVEGLIITFGE